jgi:hypothetical protein
MPDDAVNPDLGTNVGEVPLMALHGEFTGKAAVVPQVRAEIAPRVTWDPTTYERASWESTGIYDGGAVVHVWGTETGWFEYSYEIIESDSKPRPTGPVRVRLARTLTVRARVSSEYPGTTSPPEGASAFSVTLDGIDVGASTAVRDDGRGAWVSLRTSKSDVLQAAVQPGKHLLRFVVVPGPHAHGLCIYGKPGVGGGSVGHTGPVELQVDR